MKKIVVFIFSLTFFNSYSQEEVFKKGVIMDSVTIDAATGESFALYLPKKNDSSKPSAIIFIFDPVARGKIGVEVFKEAADRFNYILVCSNDSKNGPYEVNFNIANRLFEYIFSKFKIDEKRIYTAGFSGGSRLASSIAVLTNSIQGVIACGAGFSEPNHQKPNLESKFSYVGLVGDEDMNYQEMLSTKPYLNSMNIEHEILTYEDGHRWPSKYQINRAVSWLELQAYKRKIKDVSPELVKKMYKESFALADSLSNEQPYNAVSEYERIEENYSTYFELDSIVKKIEELKSTEEYKVELDVNSQIEIKEYRLSDPFLKKFREESFLGRSDDNFVWWKNELKKLDREEKLSQDFFTVKMMKRIRYKLMAMAVESSNSFVRNKGWHQALYCDNLLVLMHPEQPYWFFRLAQSHARLNEFGQTLTNLKKAIQKGFKDINAIRMDKDFEKFKSKKKFQKFLGSLSD